MSCQDLDRDIEHLERVFGRLTVGDCLPLSYWEQRLHDLLTQSPMPAQRARIVRLQSVLYTLRDSGQTICHALSAHTKEARR
jgi:hypothetical protein